MFGENALDTNKQEEKQELLPASVTEAGNEKYLGLGLGLPVRVQFTGSVNFGFTTTPGKRAYRQKKKNWIFMIFVDIKEIHSHTKAHMCMRPGR